MSIDFCNSDIKSLLRLRLLTMYVAAAVIRFVMQVIKILLSNMFSGIPAH